MRFWKLIAATALAALCLLPVAQAASAATGMEVGLQDDAVFLRTYYNIHKAVSQARGLHTGRVRVFVYWGSIGGAAGNKRKKPKTVKYNFAAYDALLYYVSQQGQIPVQLVLTGPAPAWATGNHRKGVVSPNAGYFRDFAAQAAAHFKGRVDEYSIWNEPNYLSWLEPQKRAASIYRSLYVNGYSAIKAVDPNAKVLIGETSPYAERRLAIAPLAFLRSVLCVNRSYHLKHGCKGLQTDGYATHPYDFYHPPNYRHRGGDNVTISTLSRATSALSRLASSGALRTPQGGTPYLYLTEYGYLASAKHGRPQFNNKQRARFLVQAFNIALRNPRVKELLQYTLVPARGIFRFFDMSIVDKHGRPEAPYNALAKWAAAEAKAHRIATYY